MCEPLSLSEGRDGLRNRCYRKELISLTTSVTSSRFKMCRHASEIIIRHKSPFVKALIWRDKIRKLKNLLPLLKYCLIIRRKWRISKGRAGARETRGKRQMSTKEIQRWLKYWQAANMVAVDAIMAHDQVYQCRRFCKCMREGVFTDVTDLQIWNALVEMRSGKRSPFRQQETAA